MRGNRRHWPGLLSLLLLLAGLGGLTAKLTAATKESVDKATEEAAKVVSPPDRSVLLSGNFDVIYCGGEATLEIDSRPIPWEESYVSPIRVGHVHLSPGVHRVKIGDRNVQLCVALNEMEHDAPSDWQIHRVHTMSAEKDRCAECHDAESQDKRVIVGKVLIPDSCMTCHTEREVKEIHHEFIQPLKSCQTCHTLHGSPHPSLLNAPAAQIRKEHAAAR